jgi:hypothetical protein
MPTQIKKGTPNSEVDLCKKCKHSTIIEGQRLDETFTYCSVIDKHITFRVYDCSAFKKVNELELWELKSIAWLLEEKGSSKQIGFVPPSKLSKALKNILDDVRDPFDK